MLKYPAREVVCYTDIQDIIVFIGKYIYVELFIHVLRRFRNKFGMTHGIKYGMTFKALF